MIAEPPQLEMSVSRPFVAHDFCGWNEQHGRYTVCPGESGREPETLVCRPHMDQTDWDVAQLKFLEKLPADWPVHSCPTVYTTEGTRSMGTCGEICERLRKRLH